MTDQPKKPEPKDGITRKEFLVGAGVGVAAAATMGAGAAFAQSGSDLSLMLSTEGSEVMKDADGTTTGYGIKLYKPVTEELRQTVREDFPELVSETWVSEDLRTRAIEAMTLSLAMSTFERWSDVPG